MRMRNLTLLVVPLLAALIAQAAVASENHRTRTKGRTVAIEQFRNSNALGLPGNIAAQSNLSAEDKGAMTPGTAGPCRERNAGFCRPSPFDVEIPSAISDGQAKANAASKTWPGDMILD